MLLADAQLSDILRDVRRGTFSVAGAEAIGLCFSIHPWG